MKGENMAIKDRIKDLRQSSHLSQTELYNITGISQAQISKFEKGLVVPSLESIFALAKAFKVNPIEILRDDLELSEEEVEPYKNKISTKEPINESKQLLETLNQLNEDLRRLASILTAAETTVACSMLDLCKETLRAKKDTDIKSAKTA